MAEAASIVSDDSDDDVIRRALLGGDADLIRRAIDRCDNEADMDALIALLETELLEVWYRREAPPES